MTQPETTQPETDVTPETTPAPTVEEENLPAQPQVTSGLRTRRW